MRGMFLLLIVIPIAELMLLLEIGSRIGVLPTLAIVVTTAFIGINVLRHQGFSTLTRAQLRMQNGELPAQELVEGFMLAIGGALLLAPGFITDTIGFTLLLPWSRKFLARKALSNGGFSVWGQGSSQAGFSVFRAGGWQQGTKGSTGQGKPGGMQGDILDGEVIREPEPAPRLKEPPQQ